MTGRDTIILGASAGGIDAISRVIHTLPHDLASAVLVVQHMAPHAEPMLVAILQRASEIAVRWAEQGDRIEPGYVYVAPTGVHIMITNSHIQLVGGERENFVRPSIDRLLRSAAETRGPRTIGVLLTGMLDDGVAGMRALQRAGGYTIVQDPADAAYPDLPAHALVAFTPDRILPAAAIGDALLGLVGRSVIHA